MKSSKIMLSVFMVFVIILISVVPVFAVVAPEDTASSVVLGVNKIDSLLSEKMANATDNELIPVWVWMTDIDMEKLENDIETVTGLSQQKLTAARNEISYDSLATSLNNVSLAATDKNLQTTIREEVTPYLEATKVQRQEIAEDTEIYLTAKKSLAKQQYITTNTTKIRQLGIANNRIDFKSELTPSFIAFLTHDEIVEMTKSNVVVEMGYFDEYDEEAQAPEQVETFELNIDPTEAPTIDASTLHTAIKQAIQHDDALQKYDVTGNEIKVLHVDHDYVRSDHTNFDLVPYPENIYNVIEECTQPVTEPEEIPIGPMYDHANLCVSYLQSFAKDVQIYSVAKQSSYNNYNEVNGTNINTYNDIEYAITDLDVDLINASCHDGIYVYQSDFSAKWYDAIISMYNIPLIASGGNHATNNSEHVIAPASGFNSIAVGAYNSTNGKMYNYSYNPFSSTPARVSFKPDLVVAMNQGGGTSASAPVVSGIVAMMMELDPSLIGCPEVVKAILMASCHEKAQQSDADATEGEAQETMEEGLTLKQGAGKVNALRALNIVAFGTYGYVAMWSTDNYVYAPNIYLNSEVYGDSNVNYPLNVSIAWLRENTKSSNVYEDINSTTLGTKHELNLKVWYSGQNDIDIKQSTTENSGKQLVFYETPVLDKEYRVRIFRGTEDVNNNESFLCGYAYSVGNFEKALESVEITGQTAVGKTLTATAYTADGVLAETAPLYYYWYSSSDGEDWTWMRDVHTSTYTLTSTDINKYFYCEVTQDYLCDIYRNGETTTSVVLYGDVNNDSDINSLDATIIRRYIFGLVELTSEQMLAADVNGDNIVNDADATLIQQYSAYIIYKFPVED